MLDNQNEMVFNKNLIEFVLSITNECELKLLVWNELHPNEARPVNWNSNVKKNIKIKKKSKF